MRTKSLRLFASFLAIFFLFGAEAALLRQHEGINLRNLANSTSTAAEESKFDPKSDNLATKDETPPKQAAAAVPQMNAVSSLDKTEGKKSKVEKANLRGGESKPEETADESGSDYEESTENLEIPDQTMEESKESDESESDYDATSETTSNQDENDYDSMSNDNDSDAEDLITPDEVRDEIESVAEAVEEAMDYAETEDEVIEVLVEAEEELVEVEETLEEEIEMDEEKENYAADSNEVQKLEDEISEDLELEAEAEEVIEEIEEEIEQEEEQMYESQNEQNQNDDSDSFDDSEDYSSESELWQLEVLAQHGFLYSLVALGSLVSCYAIYQLRSGNFGVDLDRLLNSNVNYQPLPTSGSKGQVPITPDVHRIG